MFHYIEASIANRLIQVAFDGGCNHELIPFFPEVNKYALDNLLGFITTMQNTQGIIAQGAIPIAEQCFKALTVTRLQLSKYLLVVQLHRGKNAIIRSKSIIFSFHFYSRQPKSHFPLCEKSLFNIEVLKYKGMIKFARSKYQIIK